MFFLSNLLTEFDWQRFLIIALGFSAACLLLGFIFRGIWGRNSNWNRAISSAVGILFIYMITIIIMMSDGELAQFEPFLSPLPFVEIEGSTISIFPISESSHPEICAQILSMIILAFLVNLLDGLFPKGHNIITWLFFRCCTIILSMLAHVFVTGQLESVLPETFLANAPVVLLWILVIMLCLGALKYLIGIALATVNPIIGFLYTFFFASAVGRQLTKSVISTAILTALVYAVEQTGISVLTVDPSTIPAYLTFAGILAGVWYLITRE